MREPIPHTIPEFGLPYAAAGITTDASGLTRATATCPCCDHVSVGPDSKAAVRAYGRHFIAAANAESVEA